MRRRDTTLRAGDNDEKKEKIIINETNVEVTLGTNRKSSINDHSQSADSASTEKVTALKGNI